MWSIMGIIGQERDSNWNRPFSRSVSVRNDYKFRFYENISILCALCEWRDGGTSQGLTLQVLENVIYFYFFVLLPQALLIKNHFLSVETTSDLSTGPLKKSLLIGMREFPPVKPWVC